MAPAWPRRSEASGSGHLWPARSMLNLPLWKAVVAAVLLAAHAAARKRSRTWPNGFAIRSKLVFAHLGKAGPCRRCTGPIARGRGPSALAPSAAPTATNRGWLHYPRADRARHSGAIQTLPVCGLLRLVAAGWLSVPSAAVDPHVLRLPRRMDSRHLTRRPPEAVPECELVGDTRAGHCAGPCRPLRLGLGLAPHAPCQQRDGGAAAGPCPVRRDVTARCLLPTAGPQSQRRNRNAAPVCQCRRRSPQPQRLT